MGENCDLDGLDVINTPEATVTRTDSGGKLLFSDSPEKPTTTGKLAFAQLPAPAAGTSHRLYVYHVNGNTTAKRLAVVLENTGAGDITVTKGKLGIAGPSTSYSVVGKRAVQRYLSSTNNTTVTVPGNGKVVLDSTFDTTNISTNYLYHGIWDVSWSGADLKVHVCLKTTTASSTSFCPGATVLARDATHQRGTFPNADRIIDPEGWDTASGVRKLTLGGNTANDPHLVGTDETDGSSQTLKGNYGLFYRMHLNYSSTDGRNVGHLINPRGGAYNGAVNVAAGVQAQGVYNTPATDTALTDNTFGTIAGRWNPSTHPSPWTQYMLPGASSAPNALIMAPYTP